MALLIDIKDALGDAFPWELAPAGDGSGILLGRSDDDIKTVTCALDPMAVAVESASAGGAGLLVVHHTRLLIEGMLQPDTEPGSSITRSLISSGTSVIGCHLNADAAPGGAADIMARGLGIDVEGPLAPLGGAYLAKVVVFVPPQEADSVAQAMFEAGAGTIGGYTRCSFRSEGTGTYVPGADSSPFRGAPGRMSREEEVRLEVTAPSFSVEKVVRAMREVHPYEEVAYDIYRTENPPCWGLGRSGALPGEMSVHEVAAAACSWCGTDRPAFVSEDAAVRRAAVVPGSGSGLLEAALRAGCDIMVTGELAWQDRVKAGEAGMALVCLGHRESELPLVGRMANVLARASERGRWELGIISYDGKEGEGA